MPLTVEEKILLKKQEIKIVEGEEYVVEARARIAYRVGNKERAQELEGALLIVVNTLEEHKKELVELEKKAEEHRKELVEFQKKVEEHRGELIELEKKAKESNESQ